VKAETWKMNRFPRCPGARPKYSTYKFEDNLMNQQHNITTGPHRWKKGETGNPAGRPLGARQKISEKLLADLADVWQEHGKAVLTRLVSEDPGKLAQIAFGLGIITLTKQLP
jgi:Family of unknown function (DUF5681)